MRGFTEIFWLELRGLIRSRTLAILTLLSVGWMLAAPYVFRSDGTAAGAREMCVRYSLGGVTMLLAVVLVVSAAGALARERAARRLQLTMVRPVRAFTIVAGKVAALSLVGAIVLGLSATIELLRQEPTRQCWSVRRPILPSPAEEAKAMYDIYMSDPRTPPAVKKAKKSTVLRLLAQRAIDRYETIGTNDTVRWWFRLPEENLDLAMRFRFTNMYEMRDEVRGYLQGDGFRAAVSNITQAVITIPLERLDRPDCPSCAATNEVSFTNHGVRSLMLRPRQDVELLARADGFAANLLRAYLELVAMLVLMIAFGAFLGASLSQPVAVFVAVVTLALGEMSPSVIEQYPDQLERDLRDSIGLVLARFAASVTHPVGSLHPLADLAADNRVEPREVLEVCATDAVALPLALLLLAAVVMPRKTDVV